MSNAFVTIKKCYVYSQWCDISCATLYIYDNISLNYSQIEKCFRHQCRQNEKAHFVVRNVFSGNHSVCEIIKRVMVQPERPQTAI